MAEPGQNPVKISFLIPAHRAGLLLPRTLEEVRSWLMDQYPGRFEILVIPNGNCQTEEKTSFEVLNRLMDTVLSACGHPSDRTL